MAGRGRGSPLAVSLKKIGSWLAMLSIRLYQRFSISVISPDYDTVITKSFFVLMLDSETVSYEEIFPGKFGVGGVKNFLERKKRFLRGNFPVEFPRPKFPQEILARILLAEEILKPKISWRQEEILRGNFGIT